MNRLSYWNGLEIFKRKIKSLGGVWNTENVYFSQHTNCYSAAYKLNYPNNSHNDISIICDPNKYTVWFGSGRVYYYKDIEELREYMRYWNE